MMQLQWNQPLLSTTIQIRIRSKAKGGVQWVMGNYELQIETCQVLVDTLN